MFLAAVRHCNQKISHEVLNYLFRFISFVWKSSVRARYVCGSLFWTCMLSAYTQHNSLRVEMIQSHIWTFCKTSILHKPRLTRGTHTKGCRATGLSCAALNSCLSSFERKLQDTWWKVKYRKDHSFWTWIWNTIHSNFCNLTSRVQDLYHRLWYCGQTDSF